MTDKLLKLPLDTNKRHLVLGDAHGRHEAFLRLLDEANYDPETDIIYSVGDLIDRGPHSYEMLEFFSRPNTYACIGNHEYMAGPGYLHWGATWMMNGGVNCMYSLDDNNVDRDWLEEYVEEMPWIIEVGELEDDNCFRIVHADYDPIYNDQAAEHLLNNALDEDGLFDGENNDIQPFIWSRTTITTGLRNVAEMRPIHHNISFTKRKRHTFCGHTPIRKPTTIKDITFLDTWGAGTLTLVDAITREEFTVTVNPDNDYRSAYE